MRKAFIKALLNGIKARAVFETLTVTGNNDFTWQDSSVSQIFNLIISNGGKILSNIKVVVNR